ncbi:MAG: HAD family hydrolase [Rhodothermales bacterium]
MKLLLFDIDGTIVLTHGVGRRSVERALSETCGRPIDASSVTFSGKTDPQIIAEVLDVNGFDRATFNGLERRALSAYQRFMESSLVSARVELLPGVAALIKHLDGRNDVQLALLTGNLEPLAYRKLRAVGLDCFFAFGAFGSDHPDRYHLPPIAVERALHHTGRRFEGRDVVIIGDTEHDIGCGRGIGALSVGVCTGQYDRACLRGHGADVLFDRLDNTQAFVDAVLQ